MKAPAAALEDRNVRLLERFSDLLELTKPRIAVMVLITVATGAFLAGHGKPDLWAVIHALVGTALVASGASAFNQILETETDRLMPRTRNRPIPAGRLSFAEAGIFAVVTSIGGIVYLAYFTNPMTVILAATSLVLYVVVYTPLKRATSLNTVIGAIPGALPPMIGWAAERGSIDSGSLTLFAILFFWQFPHFLAIAWLYRDDYRSGGLKMLPTTAEGQKLAGLVAVSYALVLVPVSLLPAFVGLAGRVYFWSALVLSLQYLGYSMAFWLVPSDRRARQLLLASLVYLPVVMGLLALRWWSV